MWSLGRREEGVYLFADTLERIRCNKGQAHSSTLTGWVATYVATTHVAGYNYQKGQACAMIMKTFAEHYPQGLRAARENGNIAYWTEFGGNLVQRHRLEASIGTAECHR